MIPAEAFLASRTCACNRLNAPLDIAMIATSGNSERGRALTIGERRLRQERANIVSSIESDGDGCRQASPCCAT